MVDIAVVTIALLIAMPVLVLVAVLVVCSMGRPVIFTQCRAGRSGQPFTIFKFRSMRDAEFPGQSDQDRVTRVGRLLRSTSLDEVPQLWNIMRGDMTLIGPRPTLPEQVQAYDQRQRGRLAVAPGLTGLAQVSGRTALTWPERIELDLWYVANRSLALDLRILVLTVVRAVRLRRDEIVDDLAPGGDEAAGAVPTQRSGSYPDGRGSGQLAPRTETSAG